MKKYITLAALLAAGTVFANATIITDLEAFDGKSSSASITLAEEDILTMTISGGKSWGITSNDDSWTNTVALAQMNSDLGLAITVDEINAYRPFGSGQGGSWTDLTLNISSIGAGEEIVLYTLATAAGSAMSNFNVTGLGNVQISYACADGDGFSDQAAYTSGALNYTLIKVTGTLTENTAIVLSARNANKNAWGMVAYNTISSIPEPSAFGMLAGLGALALVASRRRRK